MRIMNKLAGLVVDKRYIVLGAMLLIIVACGIAIPRVNINADMTKYLPDDSSMKVGLDIMKEEFPEVSTTRTVRVMFDDLAPNEKMKIKSELEAIQHVDSVDYEADSADYNKGSHTLYVLHTVYDYGSAEEKAVEAAVKENFSGYAMTLKNDGDGLTDVISVWIVALAFSIMMVILFAMCGSWLEPFLFLLAIGCAILINMGSNIFIGEVSNITSSIAAILQMVLSMDYSIILMNRYRQELKTTDNTAEAMKLAIKNAFSSIISSAFTTIVGLLALVFMRFKIGFDMGFVLAKGVALSLICIFTILPGLILIFDKAIKKTAKRELHIPTGRLGSVSYRFRGVFAAAFVLLFVVSFIMQGYTKTAFTLEKKDPIADIFTPDNTIVLVYGNADDKAVTEIAETLESDPRVRSAASYSTTIGKEYAADELAGLIDDMGIEIDIDAELLNILYYDYFNGGKTPAVTAGEFINFIADDVVTNKNFADYITPGIKNHAGELKKFADAGALTVPMNTDELSAFFGIDAEDVKRLFIYYYTQNGGAETGTMTLPAFAGFINDEVINDRDYSSMLDKDMLSQMERLTAFTDAEKMTSTTSYSEIAGLFGLDNDSAKLMFAYYFASAGDYAPPEMSVPEFVTAVRQAAGDPLFQGNFAPEMLAQIEILAQFTDKNFIQSQLSAGELAGIFGIDAAVIERLFAPRSGGEEQTLNQSTDLPADNAGGGVNNSTMSPEQFVNYLYAGVLQNPGYAAVFDENTKQQLVFLQSIMSASESGVKMNFQQLANLLGMDVTDAKTLMTVNAPDTETASWRLSPRTAVNFLLDNSSAFGSSMGNSELDGLRTAADIIDGSAAGTAYTAENLASLLDMNPSDINSLFLLYTGSHGDVGGWKLSAQTFVDFIAGDVLSSDDFSDAFDADSARELTSAKTLVDAVVSGKSYHANEMSDLLGGLSDELDADTIGLMYLYRAGLNDSGPDWKLSMQALFDYLSGEVVSDPRFTSMLGADFRRDIDGCKADLDDGTAQLRGAQYSRLILSTTLQGESEETSEFFKNLTAGLSDRLTGKYYLIGNSAMNYEMENSFGREMLVISLLTAVSIFIVVLLTFRNFAVPAILILIVQCGVYITGMVVGVQGFSIYYLALLIVQSILMGATIDYGILFTNYYREKRETMDSMDALKAAYEGSIHTILTSGLIMILVTGIVGYLFEDPVIGQICRTISIGALSASSLILLVLPGLLATFDKIVVKKGRENAETSVRKVLVNDAT